MASDGFVADVESGSRLRALRALRGVLASAIEAAEPREIAPLARQLQLVLSEIDVLHPPKPDEESFLDGLDQRFKDRIAEAKAS